MAQARTTFLEAANRVLQMLGEAPVNSLDGQYGLALQAQDALNTVSRTLQAEGWSFNTDREKFLQRNQNNEIVLGSNVSRVVIDLMRYPTLDVVQRGNKLYDRYKNTYAFDADIYADVTYLLEWEELPEHARQYITAKAGRQLQEAIIGSTELTRLNLTAELEAKALFMDEETVVNDHSMLRGNPNHTGVFMAYMPSRALRRM